jgi:hypothetical protein
MSAVIEKLSEWGVLKPKQPPPAAGTAPVGPRPTRVVPPPKPVGESELERRRGELARRFAELQWDLGGVAYEMASRDHFRLDVLTRQAAALQEVDAQLAEVERLLKLDSGGAAGSCKSCGALYARGAGFCWHCGQPLIAEATPSAPVVPAPAEPVQGGTAQ